MENIAVSVIIPVYNVEKYLAACLDSVISQDIQEIELICVNDGSMDSSQEILNAYAKKDKRIVVINQENKGLSGARNAGVECARGEYIFFLDSDDCLVEHVLRKLYITAKTENAEIVTFDAECFYETDELKKKEYKDNYYQRKKEYAGVWTGEELYCELMENDDFCDSACIMMIKNSWLKKTGISFVPGILHEDCLFSFQCYMNVKRIIHKKWKCIRYRIREHSIMTSRPSFCSLMGRLTCYKEIFRFLMRNKFSDRTEAAIAKYMELIMYNIKYVDFALKDEEKKATEKFPAVDRLLMNSLGIGKSGRYTMNAAIYELGFWTLICRTEKIILYGAGKIGTIVWNYLKLKGMSEKVVGFAVSDKAADNKNVLDGLRVQQINEYEIDGKILVLITARWDFQTDMIDRAHSAGFGNIEVIDFRLEQCIRHVMEKEQIERY